LAGTLGRWASYRCRGKAHIRIERTASKQELDNLLADVAEQLALVVVDDPEDGEWLRMKENRDETNRWLHSEIIPGLDAGKGKLIVIVIGNLIPLQRP
jgi:hypothetical protein